MRRFCAACGREFVPADLAREESRGLAAARKSAGLAGVRVVAYRCPCGTEDVFVDVVPRDDEFAEDFDRRQAELQAVARRLHRDGTIVQVAQVVPPSPPPPATG